MTPSGTAAHEGPIASPEPRSVNSAPTTRADDAGPPQSPVLQAHRRCFALLGNPNTGKTTLFNRMCGLRAKTANFPGSTVEARIGTLVHHRHHVQVVDLPGLYSLGLDRPESRMCRAFLHGEVDLGRSPDAILIILDGTNLQRNLPLAAQALQQGLPAVVALNMADLMKRRGAAVDIAALSRALGVPVALVSARSGVGVHDVLDRMDQPAAAVPDEPLPDVNDAIALSRWSRGVAAKCVRIDALAEQAVERMTDRIDSVATHPVWGFVIFAAVMVGLFYTIFALASVPMNLIEAMFAHVAEWTHNGFVWLAERTGLAIGEGALHDLVVDGVIGGLAGTLVFLPQICLLFLLISLLEDTGYLARAAFLMDRLLRRFGLPGQAFVPLLSAHACAIPAMMSTRLIPDHRDRMAAIMVIPFMSCSARLPVYVLLIGVLFGGNALAAGLAFAGCYLLGAAAALLTSLLFRRTVLRGPDRPMVLELPSYKWPSLYTALLATWDRGLLFLRKAGTVIMVICIVLWWLGAYPAVDPPHEAVSLRDQATAMKNADPVRAEELATEADDLERRHAAEASFIGRLGRAVEPVFAPIGCDWQVSIAVLSSFAAREVFVSSLTVVLTGSEEDAAEDQTVRERIVNAVRDDGTPVFTISSAAALLVFYVLAMQCLPTLAVTRRETGSWGWAALQLGYMSAVAYAAAFITRAALLGLGYT